MMHIKYSSAVSTKRPRAALLGVGALVLSAMAHPTVPAVPAAAATFPQGGPGPVCEATTEDFICPYEELKWTELSVTSSAVSSGATCTGHCNLTWSAYMKANNGTYGTYDVTEGGQQSTVTFSSSDVDESWSGDEWLDCDTVFLFDVSYQEGNCPTECPDGPGYCSIIATELKCGVDC